MKTIELKCPCGAEFKYEDSKDDWPLDPKKYRFTVEETAGRWLEAHRDCLQPATAGKDAEGETK